MTRTIYLIIYNSPLFPAHWSLWIPSLHNPTTGKRLHATGDAATGFTIVFERNYVMSADSRQHQCLPLADVSDHHVVDVNGDGSEGSDSIAHDDLERILLSVAAPGASLLSAGTQVREFFDSQNALLNFIDTGTKEACADSELSDVATRWSHSTGPERDHGPVGLADD